MRKIKALFELLKAARYVIEGYSRMWLFNLYLTPKHITEQIIFRLREADVKQCIINGECVYCGCTTLPKLCSQKPTRHHYYNKFLSRIEWEAYKAINNETRNHTTNSK